MKNKKNKIDWIITLVPLISIFIISLLFFTKPQESNIVLSGIRYFFGNSLGSVYIIVGLGIFLISIYLCFSKYGNVVLGNPGEKPKYSFFAWGSMMFTCGLAADILFYSFCEWVMYSGNSHITDLGSFEEWAGVFPIFHWSFIPWGFYLVLAVAFGFMLHVRKRNRQRFSEACKPIIKNQTEGIVGRIIDLLAVFALLAGTATTFSVATPLMSNIIAELFDVAISKTLITVIIIVITCVIYTYSLLHGFKGISILANSCIYMFALLLAYVFVCGGQARFILENGIQSLGKVIENFIGLSTYMDPARSNSFPQDWTIYYWAYWMVWCVAAPFFIGNISRGRTIKQTIIGGYIFGVGSTILSFIVLGNYSLGLQVSGIFDFVKNYATNGDLYQMIISVINSLPLSSFVHILTLATMIAFYATSFDSIAYTASCYSYRKLEQDEQPNKAIQLLWCILLVLLPIALVFSESSMGNLQSLSIVAAFPICIVMVLIISSFIKDLIDYYNELNN